MGFAIVAVAIMMCVACTVAVSDESDAATHGSQSNPVSSISGGSLGYSGDVFYAKVGASVNLTNTNSESGSYVEVTYATSVTSGYGLSIGYDSSYYEYIHGTISKPGTIVCSFYHEDTDGDDYDYTITIYAVSPQVLVNSVSISGPTSADVGGSVTLNATVSPSNATNTHVKWSITSGSANGSITSTSNLSNGGSCVLRVSSEGSVTVKATSGDGGAYDTHTITVTQPSKTYYLKFDANGGYGAPSQLSGSSKYGDYTFTIPQTQPSRAGYTFLGWSTSSTASSANFQPGGSVTSYGTKVLYAVWQQDLHTYYAKLNFSANGGSGAPSALSKSIQAVSASGSYTFTVPSSVPTRSGYTFLGWSTNSGASAASFTSGDRIAVAYGSSVNLYAVWEQMQVSVSGTPSSTGVVGSSWTFTPTLNYGGVTLSLNGPSWLHVSGGKLIGTPTAPGTYDFTLTASKTGCLSDTLSFSVTVYSALSFTSSPTGGAIFYAI